MTQQQQTAALYKVGDLVQKSWLKGRDFPPGVVLDISIATRHPNTEFFVYQVKFPTCTGHFVENDLIPINNEILEETSG